MTFTRLVPLLSVECQVSMWAAPSDCQATLGHWQRPIELVLLGDMAQRSEDALAVVHPQSPKAQSAQSIPTLALVASDEIMRTMTHVNPTKSLFHLSFSGRLQMPNLTGPTSLTLISDGISPPASSAYYCGPLVPSTVGTSMS